MLSATLSDGLQRYRIGPKIRALRLKRKLGLAQLGKHAGLSPALLSKIERDQLFPTLPTLLRIALVFGVGLEHFFAELAARPTRVLVKSKERLRLPEDPGQPHPAYYFESLDFPMTNRRMETFYASFPRRSSPSSPHQHAGIEFIFLIGGKLSIGFSDETVLLEPGDALSFDSSSPHSYKREGLPECTAIVVTLPA